MNFDSAAMQLARKKLGLTQVEYAILLGVHPITVSKWERGHAEPTSWQYCIARSLRGAGFDVSMMLHTRGPVYTLAFCLRHLV